MLFVIVTQSVIKQIKLQLVPCETFHGIQPLNPLISYPNFLNFVLHLIMINQLHISYHIIWNIKTAKFTYYFDSYGNIFKIYIGFQNKTIVIINMITGYFLETF